MAGTSILPRGHDISAGSRMRYQHFRDLGMFTGSGVVEAGWLVHMLQSAWVGDMRAALMAGKSPATAPMITAAASPPAHA
jgi:hypothetical protein